MTRACSVNRSCRCSLSTLGLREEDSVIANSTKLSEELSDDDYDEWVYEDGGFFLAASLPC
jgi:hypothetical protein